ncbi:MAG: hypothetical protein ACRC1P_12020 [Cellulosilyticaceae bacterium]
MQSISSKDREIIRELAKKQYDYSQLPSMKETEKEWYKHNQLQGNRPMIHIEMGTFDKEIILGLLKCESEQARQIEASLYKNFLNHEICGDDRVVADFYGVSWRTYFRLFDRQITVTHAKDSVGHQFNYIIKDLQEDLPNLGQTKFGVDKEGTLAYKAFLEDLFGDVLPVKMTSSSLGAVPTQDVVHMMGMEQMFFAMYDYPDEFHAFMNRIAEDYINYFKWLETEGLLMTTTGNQWLGQGSFCYTDELPNQEQVKGRLITTQDMWGFMDSQETVSLSPDMYEEFIFPYYKKVSELFGLFSYGCCEPVDPFWDKCISKFENLRKVSISPWCNEEKMGNELRGSKIIYHRKPSPNYLGVGKELDEEAFSKHIIDTLRAAKGCKLEIAQRDVYTLGGNIPKARRYVEIIRNLIDKYWE